MLGQRDWELPLFYGVIAAVIFAIYYIILSRLIARPEHRGLTAQN